MLLTRMRCGRNWPRHWITYHQEIEYPFRRAEHVHVYRIGTLGIVFGRWTSTCEDEYEAITQALAARNIAALDDQGHLTEMFWRKENQQ